MFHEAFPDYPGHCDFSTESISTFVSKIRQLLGTSFVLLAYFTLTATLCRRHCFFHCTDDETALEKSKNVSSVRAGKSQDGNQF